MEFFWNSGSKWWTVNKNYSMPRNMNIYIDHTLISLTHKVQETCVKTSNIIGFHRETLSRIHATGS